MLSEDEKKAIKLIKQYRKEIKDGDIKPIFILDTAINLITKLQKENEEKDKQIKALVKYIDSNNYVTSNSCDFQDDFKIEKCIDEGNCKDCIRKYFEEQTKN